MQLTTATGPAKESLRPRTKSLDAFFAPQSAAVIGATETAGTVGRTLLWNLIQTPFSGTVYPINPKRKSVLGIKAYPSVADVPKKIDLAVVVIPATALPGVIHECAEVGVTSAMSRDYRFVILTYGSS